MTVDIKKNISWVKSNLIEHRIDSQFYKNEYVQNDIKIRKIKHMFLKDIYIRGDYGTLPDSNHYCDEGIYLVRGTDLRNMSIEDKNLIIVPKEYYTEKSAIKPGDILLLIKGATIDAEWSVAIAPMNEKSSIFNGSIFRMRIKNEYDPYYITAFMSTKFFLKQKTRAISNTGIFYNDKDSIENFIIPIPSNEAQKYIGDKVRKAEELREEAKSIRKQVDDTFNNLIGSSYEGNKNKEKYKWVKDNNINLANLVPEVYKSKYEESRNIISKFEMKSLNDLSVKIFDPPHTAPEFITYSNFKMIMIENITTKGINGKFRCITEVCHNNIFKNSHLDGTEILVSRVGNSSGTFAAVSEEHKGLNVSGNITIIKIDNTKIDKDYVACYFNSEVGQNYIRQHISNTARKFLTIGKIKQFEVPIPGKYIQSHIGEYLRKYNELILCVEKLIQEAKKDVEDLIEGNFDMSKIKESN